MKSSELKFILTTIMVSTDSLRKRVKRLQEENDIMREEIHKMKGMLSMALRRLSDKSISSPEEKEIANE